MTEKVVDESGGSVFAVTGILFLTKMFLTAEEEVNLRHGLLLSVLAVHVVPGMEGWPALVFVEGKTSSRNRMGMGCMCGVEGVCR